MELRDRSGRYGFTIKLSEDFLNRASEFFFNDRGGFLRREWRNVLLQLLELNLELARNQIRTVAEYLTELDEGGPEFLDCHPDSFPGSKLAGLLSLARAGSTRELTHEPQRATQTGLIDDLTETMRQQREENVAISRESKSSFAGEQSQQFQRALL